MTYKDILASKKKYLADLIDAREKGLVNVGTPKRIEETEMIIDALRWCIPEKVIYKLTRSGDNKFCPVCNSAISTAFGKPKYCCDCGQALDWGE